MVVGSEVGIGAKSVGTRPTSSMLVSMIIIGEKLINDKRGMRIYANVVGGVSWFFFKELAVRSSVVRSKRISAMQLKRG